MDSAQRERMQALFGYDFGSVRLHAGAAAQASANALHARAFTVGRDVVLGEQPTPGSAAHDRLIAHELAHVVQQGAADFRSGPLRLGHAGEPAEREADSAASAVERGLHPRVTAAREEPTLRRDAKPGAPAPQQQPAAPAPKAPATNADFEDCSQAEQQELQGRANDARVWVRDARQAVQKLKASRDKKQEPELRRLFLAHFQFDPGTPGTEELMNEVENSYAKMEQGVGTKVTFACMHRQGSGPAKTTGGLFSCSGRIEIYDSFFESEFGLSASSQEEKDFKTHILVHELAHNFAGREGEVRPGFTPMATGCEKQEPKYEALGPKRAVGNAESYALFAQGVQRKSRP